MIERLPESAMEDRHIYRIHSRNLVVGAWRASSRGFIGIREKFGSLYLFEEYHSETGPPYGTAVASSAYDLVVPDDMELDEDSDALFDLLKPLDEAIHEQWRIENERMQLEAESKRMAPQTKEEYDKEQRIEAVRQWRKEQVEAMAGLIGDELRERNKALHREWVDRLTAAIKGE